MEDFLLWQLVSGNGEAGGHDTGRGSPPVLSPMRPSQGTNTRLDGGCRNEARAMPGWETTSVVWGGEGGGCDMAQAGSNG